VKKLLILFYLCPIEYLANIMSGKIILGICTKISFICVQHKLHLVKKVMLHHKNDEDTKKYSS
jgi:phage-related holin